MASRDKVDVDMFHKSIQYALEKLGKSKSGFERTVVSKFKRKRRVGSGNELVDYSRAPCLGADQKARGLWERDCAPDLQMLMIRRQYSEDDIPNEDVNTLLGKVERKLTSAAIKYFKKIRIRKRTKKKKIKPLSNTTTKKLYACFVDFKKAFDAAWHAGRTFI